MGCGFTRQKFQLQKTVVVEILNEDQALNSSGAELVKCNHEGKNIRFYYKPLYKRDNTKP